jgi:hypothetical protein
MDSTEITTASLRPCVGCGYCCSKAPCAAAQSTEAPCKHLVAEEGRSWCGLILMSPPDVRRRLAVDLAIGEGCCSPLNRLRQERISQLTREQAARLILRAQVARP